VISLLIQSNNYVDEMIQWYPRDEWVVENTQFILKTLALQSLVWIPRRRAGEVLIVRPPERSLEICQREEPWQKKTLDRL